MRPSLPEDCEKRTLELDRYGHGEILCRPRFSQAARAGRGDVLAKTKCRAVYAWKMMPEKTNIFIGECGRGVLKASSCVDTLSAMTSRAIVTAALMLVVHMRLSRAEMPGKLSLPSHHGRASLPAPMP